MDTAAVEETTPLPADPDIDTTVQPYEFNEFELARLTWLKERIGDGRIHEFDFSWRDTKRLLFVRGLVRQRKLNNDADQAPV